jgi:hypothetical protein
LRPCWATEKLSPARKDLTDGLVPTLALERRFGEVVCQFLGAVLEELPHLPPGTQHQEDWERAADLLLVAVDSSSDIDIEQATFQIERALLFHRLLALL